MKCNYKIITHLSCYYKVITKWKSNYKIITNLCRNYIVITLFLPTVADCLSFQTELKDGMLAYGRTEPGEEIFVAADYLNVGKTGSQPVKIPTNSQGLFAVGIPQDARQLKLIIKTPTDSKEKIFSVNHRQWDEEYVTGLPSQKVTPNAQDSERITAEALEMKQARQVSDYDYFPEKWENPVPEYTRISSRFGSRRILNNVKKQGHSGTDLAATVGSRILAPAAGRVVYINPDMFLTGQTVMIDHGYGVFSSYSHMSAIHVQLNQELQMGDLIGEVGQTGRASGPHLHWTVTWYGIRVNPEDLIQDIIRQK